MPISTISHQLGTNPEEISDQLDKINRQIHKLNLPLSVFLSTHINKDGSFQVAQLGKGGRITVIENNRPNPHAPSNLCSWINRHQKKHNLKIIALGLGQRHRSQPLISKLWFDLDIVPHLIAQPTHTNHDDLIQTVRITANLFNPDNSAKPILNRYNRVEVSHLARLEDYQATVSPSQFQLLADQAAKFKGKTLSFFSATPQGGGVALMRHALIRLYQLLDVNAHWHVLNDQPEIFAITKTKFHNVLQNVANPNIKLNSHDKKLFTDWSAENAANFKHVFKSSDVIVIDDPQPSGLIPHIKNWTPKAKLIYRSHIQLEAYLANQPGTPQHTTWKFIWGFAQHAHAFISHPITEFIPNDVPKDITATMPATTDPLDGLNKDLTKDQIDYYLKLFNHHLLQTNQTPLDTSRPYLIQIARFDPSKGIPDVLDSYHHLCSKLPKQARPQLVIAGHGSIDDPDGAPIYNLIRQTLLQKKFRQLNGDIKVARLPHVDQPLNALLRRAKIALQLSHKEGFEIKVSEGLMKGVPIVAYAAGGIPLQVKHNQTGFIVPVGDTRQVTDYLHQLLTDPKLYSRMSHVAKNDDYYPVQTIANATRWLFLANQLITAGKFAGHGQAVSDLINRQSVT